MNGSPHVVVVIVNWNQWRLTLETLESLGRLTYPSYQVALVDNGSTDDSWERLKSHLSSGTYSFPVQVYRLDENTGFAGGNNHLLRILLRQPGFAFFWLLNNDVSVKPDSLTALVQRARCNSRIAMVGSRIYYFGTDRIWYAGGTINRWTGRGRSRGQGEVDAGQYNRPQPTGFVTGCSLLVRREALEDVGLMKEDYFLYYEDTDWNLRVRNYGWETWYEPASIVEHKVSSSTRTTGRNAPSLIYYNLRNRFTMVQRLGSPLVRMFSVLYLFHQLFSVSRLIWRHRSRRREEFSMLWQGFRDALLRKMGKHV